MNGAGMSRRLNLSLLDFVTICIICGRSRGTLYLDDPWVLILRANQSLSMPKSKAPEPSTYNDDTEGSDTSDVSVVPRKRVIKTNTGIHLLQL